MKGKEIEAAVDYLKAEPDVEDVLVKTTNPKGAKVFALMRMAFSNEIYSTLFNLGASQVRVNTSYPGEEMYDTPLPLAKPLLIVEFSK